ncbi:MAG: hypothetical protein HY367_03100 [Candidatus Aenigmarchaeota archaeon]|nr:hypothetical protein [Candidatus Aenigmarchaeota archaeon]
MGRISRGLGAAVLGLYAAFSPLDARGYMPKTTDGQRPYVRVVVPENYIRRVGVNEPAAVSLDTNIDRGDIRKISWTLNGRAVQMQDPSKGEVLFGEGDHLLEACLTTQKANYCDSKRIGLEKVDVSQRQATVWVTGPDGKYASGLKPEDFVLSQGDRKAKPAYVDAFTESDSNSPACIVVGLDISGSIVALYGGGRRGGIPAMVEKPDGTIQLAPEYRKLLEDAAAVMKGLYKGGASNPENRFIISLFAIGKVQWKGKASEADNAIQELEKRFIEEYQAAKKKNATALWRKTALYGNTKALQDELALEPFCADKVGAVVLWTDGLDTVEDASVYNLTAAALDEAGVRLEEFTYGEIERYLFSNGVTRYPVYVIAAPGPHSPRAEKSIQEFYRNVVTRSGGKVLHKEPEEGYKEPFARALEGAVNHYVLSWPEGLFEEPGKVKIATANPELKVTRKPAPRPTGSGPMAKAIIKDRSGKYNNHEMLAAYIGLRKAAEQGIDLGVSGSDVLESIAWNAGRFLEPGSPETPEYGMLAKKGEEAAFGLSLMYIKSSDPAKIRSGIRGLGKLERVSREKILEAAGSIPPAEEYKEICGIDGPQAGLRALKEKLCNPTGL